MAEVWVMGEMIVEIMRIKADVDFQEPELFKGPFPSGAPAICIDTVARLGHSTAIIGGVGRDGFGRCLLNRMKKDRVDTSHVLINDDGSTGCAFVTYFSNGSRKYLFHLGNTSAVSAKAPKAEVFRNAKFFHIMGCSLTAEKEFGEEILTAMNRAKSMGAKVTFDPNIRTELLKDASSLEIVRKVMGCASVLFPGREELLLITGETKIEDAVKKCFKNPALKILALKNGSHGSTAYTRDKEFTMDVYPVEAVDPTGAGDSFDGAFLCGLLEGLPLEETLKMASAAGALNTAAFGPMEGNISPDAIKEVVRKAEKADGR